MAGVPSFITEGPWWGLFGFLFVVVLLRAQSTYWLGRWVRRGAATVADHAEKRHSPRARLARRFSGPAMDRARAFLDRWGFVGVPLSFLTIGFQTAVNGAAGYTRMRWDLYTAAMLPGCVAWATMYALVGLSFLDAWRRSPWLFLGLLRGRVAAAGAVTAGRRRSAARRADAGAGAG